ncbi:TPA: UDP-N-acetylmuramate dehydrogenase [Candidatus Poribacteria bacterium]|nr:UDP-N-acetylmuramate dehydrogenase [Candidatus Poribacteria bacterium]
MKILENIPLKQYTTFKIGGPAKFFCEPKNKDEFISAFCYAKENNLPTFILGLGANVLFSDNGFNGLVIHQKNDKIDIKDNIVKAESGVVVENLINIALENNLLGVEDFSGIPSTIGGALYINLHYFEAFIADVVRSASILDKNTLEVKSVDQSWFNFGYDSSKLKTDKDYMLLDATLELKKVDDYSKYEALGKSKEIIRTRKYKYPSEPSVGSIFQNLTIQEQKQHNLPTRSVAYLIDVCGLKGTRVGDALLSHRHSNMIVNVGDAKAKDVIELADIIKEKVKERFGVDLRFEVQLIGF